MHITFATALRRTAALGIIAFAALTAAAKDIHTVVLTTQPEMHCQGCENRITDNLRYVRGVRSIKASAASKTVTVVIDAEKTSAAALVKSLKKIGYTATVRSDSPAQKAELSPVRPKKEKK